MKVFQRAWGARDGRGKRNAGIWVMETEGKMSLRTAEVMYCCECSDSEYFISNQQRIILSLYYIPFNRAPRTCAGLASLRCDNGLISVSVRYCLESHYSAEEQICSSVSL